jgi:hypothetical protein
MAFQRRWSSKFQRKLRTGPAYSVTMPRKALKARVVALVSLILCAVFGASVGVTSHSGLCKGADQQCVDGNTVPSSPDHAHILSVATDASRGFLSLSRTRALPLLYALKSGAEQTASMILVAANHVKDMDGISTIQAANSPPNNTPKDEWIRTAPLLEVDGNRCMLAHVRACACVFRACSSLPLPFTYPRTPALSLARVRELLKSMSCRPAAWRSFCADAQQSSPSIHLPFSHARAPSPLRFEVWG